MKVKTYYLMFNLIYFGISCFTQQALAFADIGGTTGQLLEQNAQSLDQISANAAAFKVSLRIHPPHPMFVSRISNS